MDEDAVDIDTPDPPTKDTIEPLPVPSDDDTNSEATDMPDTIDIDPPDEPPLPPLIDTDPPLPADPKLDPPDIAIPPDD